MGEDFILDSTLVGMAGVTREGGVGTGGRVFQRDGTERAKADSKELIMAHWGDGRGLSTPAVWG